MHPKTMIVLVMSLCLLIGITACQQPPKGDQTASPSPDARQQQRAEPSRTIGWFQVKTGMDAVEILSLLDEPKQVKGSKTNTTWYYSDRRADGPHVVFDTRQMRVDRWRAPQR